MQTVSPDKPIMGWHFVEKGGRLQSFGVEHHHVGRRRTVEPGLVLRVPLPIRLCARGLHASRNVMDALQYAPGDVACRVSLWGEVKHGADKLVAEYRRVEWMVDAADVLHLFACWCAERALRRAKVTDAPYWDAIATKRAWVAGDATDAELGAAWDAAWYADDARDAADAAWRGYVRDAVLGAARGDAWDAADAARGAAFDAERQSQERKLRRMLKAARDA